MKILYLFLIDENSIDYRLRYEMVFPRSNNILQKVKNGVAKSILSTIPKSMSLFI